jgi:hypothetical protein
VPDEWGSDHVGEVFKCFIEWVDLNLRYRVTILVYPASVVTLENQGLWLEVLAEFSVKNSVR